ncbi:hypothetical protein [Deinococcus yavapaiensis]|uniref:Uncharacterized protein n=1 Tax=Deinococcus yavapaiensis KR-236 TaxID=694435 RepID=A0A318S6U7_9DEIO|nr:hypothetical protein [Deinococcus yavapaiensis]PYE50560.1 hypothetical protein DES52_11778 [Deinococcus yavapaiensis KR-236]
MKKLLALIALIVTCFAAAQSSQATNIVGRPLCLLDQGNVDIQINDKAFLFADAAKQLDELLRAHLAARHVPLTDANCSQGNHVTATILVTDALEGYRAYSVQLYVENIAMSSLRAPRIWNKSTLLLAKHTPNDALTMLRDALTAMIDTLAADYASTTK